MYISKKAEKKQEKQAMSIHDIIKLQSTDGSWEDLTILQHLFRPEIQAIIKKEEYSTAILTYLVAKWI